MEPAIMVGTSVGEATKRILVIGGMRTEEQMTDAVIIMMTENQMICVQTFQGTMKEAHAPGIQIFMEANLGILEIITEVMVGIAIQIPRMEMSEEQKDGVPIVIGGTKHQMKFLPGLEMKMPDIDGIWTKSMAHIPERAPKGIHAPMVK